MSRRSETTRGLFAGVRAVVVDEVHAFAGDDRGWHLLAVLERLTALAGRDIQRVGLSATVGDPDDLLRWLVGAASAGRASSRPIGVGLQSRPRSTLDYVGSLGNAATVISRLHRGEKRLVFCDSRARVEELAVDLRRRGVTTVRVALVARPLDERRQAEEAFAEASDCVIVATSTLELGIDVGDLDRVIQIDARRPSPVSSSDSAAPAGVPGRPATCCSSRPSRRSSSSSAAGLLGLWGRGLRRAGGRPAAARTTCSPSRCSRLCSRKGRSPVSRWTEVVGRLPVFAEIVQSGLADGSWTTSSPRACSSTTATGSCRWARAGAELRLPPLPRPHVGVHVEPAVRRPPRLEGDRLPRPDRLAHPRPPLRHGPARRASVAGHVDRLGPALRLGRADGR